MPTLPFKLNQAGRHHIPRQKHKVTNWPAYDASLRQRGSLTVWFTDEATAAWRAEPRTTRGGQPWYSELAILTALTLRAVFRLSSNSLIVPRMAMALCVELGDCVLDGAVEVIRAGECLMSEVMPLQVAPDRFDVVQLRGVFRQPLD